MENCISGKIKGDIYMTMPTHKFFFRDVYKVAGLLFSFAGLINFLVGCLLFCYSFSFFKNTNQIKESMNGVSSQGTVMGLIFAGTGFVMFCIGIVVLISCGKRKKRQKYLRETGKRIYAKVVSIEMDYQISNNYRHPYVLNCEYSEGNGMVYRYRSGPVWDDRIDERVIGMEVPVYVDRKNPDNYYVDYQ